MRYLTFIKGEKTPAVGVLLSDSLRVLDLSHVSCSDMIGGAGSHLLEMVMAGFSPDEIERIISSNTFTGLRAQMKFISWKKI
jgi:hypothetical protein